MSFLFQQVWDIREWKIVQFKRATIKISTHGRSNRRSGTTSNEESSVRCSPDLVDERIKGSLKPLHAQISAPIEMTDRFIQSNSARETITASTRATRYQYESPFNGAPVASRFPTVAPLTTPAYSPDKVTGVTRASHQRPQTPQHAEISTEDEIVFPIRNRRAQYSQTSDVTEQYKNIINANITLLIRIKTTNTNHKHLHAQVFPFRRNNKE